MTMDPRQVEKLTKDLLPKWQNERRKLNRIDKWARWNHDAVARPRRATREYRDLAERAEAPWGDLIVSSVSQTLFIEGYRRPDQPDDRNGWDVWQANGWDARQIALNRTVFTYGLAYGICLPGKTLTGNAMPVMRGVSPREMLAVYDDPANDDWPVYAIRVLKMKGGYRLQLVDDNDVHTMGLGSLSDNPDHQKVEKHDAGVPPIVRFKNRFDLEGRSAGEIEPFIPLLGKIDQTSFDRLVVQRFGAWIVRTIAGMDVPESAAATGESVEQVKFRLSIEDFLTATDKDTKFGSLPASPLEPFISAHDADLRALAAVSQTPAFELLGTLANLNAEALAAAKSSQTAKSDERKHTLGEDYEQYIRLGCYMNGDTEGAEDFKAQVRWADTSIRSLSQAVDAYGKMAQMLGYPAELLWPKVPGITQQDVDEAKVLAKEQGGGLDALMRQLADGQSTPADIDPDVVKKKADAMGVLIRAGASTESAAREVGLTNVEFTGAVPVSLRLPESEAVQLEPV